MKTFLKYERDTKGSVVYKEIDSSGNAIMQPEATIGTLYLRKASVIGKAAPKYIEVNITEVKI